MQKHLLRCRQRFKMNFSSINIDFSKNGESMVNAVSMRSVLLLSNCKNITPKIVSYFTDEAEISKNDMIQKLELFKEKELALQISHYREFIDLTIKQKILEKKMNNLPFDDKLREKIIVKLDDLWKDFDFKKFELLGVESKDDFDSLLDNFETEPFNNYRLEAFYDEFEAFDKIQNSDYLYRDNNLNELCESFLQEFNEKIKEQSIDFLGDELKNNIFKNKRNYLESKFIEEPETLLDVAKEIFKITANPYIKLGLKGMG